MNDVYLHMEKLGLKGGTVEKKSKESFEVSKELSEKILTIHNMSERLDESMNVIESHSGRTFDGMKEISLGTKEILSSFDLINNSNQENVHTVNRLREELLTYKVYEESVEV